MIRAFAAVLLAAGLCLPVLAKADSVPELHAGSAILIEAESERVLLEKDADKQLPEASTTKIMTALLAIESGNLDRIVTVSERAARTEGSSLSLKAGETLPLRELLYGLMLQSGNDAAVAIAEAVSGSVEAFVDRMNEKAASLGLTHTHFCNPNGLHDPDHYTTARELATLAAYAMRNDTFREIVSTVTRRTENSSVSRTIRNKNRFLWEYEGCTGVKTGYTKAAGKCLVFSAKRNGMELIGVVLNCPSMWGTARTILDYGFSAFEMRPVVQADAEFTVNVLHGEKMSLPARPKTDILYPIRTDGTESLSVSTSVYDTVDAPVAAGQTVGTIRVTLNGTPLCEVPIVACESVKRLTFGTCFRRIAENW